jgi:uncharacterized protein YuzE
MKITYGRKVDALYIRFKETTVMTKHLAKGIATWLANRSSKLEA